MAVEHERVPGEHTTIPTLLTGKQSSSSVETFLKMAATFYYPGPSKKAKF